MRKVPFVAILLACLCFGFFSTKVNEKKSIYVYAGPGTAKACITQTVAAFEAHLPSYEIKTILPIEIMAGGWESQAALIVIPGGDDLPYAQALNGLGNEKIKNYVEAGGAYLGICAGAYYAGSFVEFAPGTELEVLGPRELSFFKGTVQGPHLAPYNYCNESGARAAKIEWDDELGSHIFYAYCNGGGHFVEAAKEPFTKILAYYDKPQKTAAIVECKIGNGTAILSGVHFEYDYALMNPQDPFLKDVIRDLKSTNETRHQVIKALLRRFKLTVSQKYNREVCCAV